MQGRNYKFEVEMVTEEAEQEYRVQYGYEFSWQCDEDEVPEIVSEYLHCINVLRQVDVHQKLRWMLRN